MSDSACFLCCAGRLIVGLNAPTTTTTLVSRGVEWWGHLFKETFYYNKVYFHKTHAGLYLG